MTNQLDPDSELFYQPSLPSDFYIPLRVKGVRPINYKKRFLAQRRKKLTVTGRAETDND